MSGFLDKPFMFSVGMSVFCNIMFLKWIHLFGKLFMAFPSWKSQPEIRDITMHGGHKSAQNLGHDNARCAEVCPESGIRLCMGGNGLPEI